MSLFLSTFVISSEGNGLRRGATRKRRMVTDAMRARLFTSVDGLFFCSDLDCT